ncbi:MAG: TIGR02584 family CRISPR-associated protein [Gammaproteobacteria bacterium]|nr:TIGR02584 family CRISPR-associated protein [Gammaproteobacteria bacterium]MBT4606973.1 TIGR02584 family CRISPR-associated protein [Thiotrichales bacterium]
MNSPADPDQYSKRILLSVTGLSPQVITETLYALLMQQQRPFIPTEIHLLTTQEGAERAKLALLDPKKGRFHTFCREYNIPAGKITFTDDQIHIVKGEQGEALTDIRSAADNRAAADYITRHVAHFTESPDTALHVSIAGGRKTMGFYLGYALSLYGREQDRLSHVLINAPFESEPQFYYPPREAEVIDLAKENRPVSTANAEVTLADIPFVRMRHGTPSSEEQHGFDKTIEHVQKKLGPPSLRFDHESKKLYAGGVELKMSPIIAAYYLWLAQRKKEGGLPIHWSDANPNHFLNAYRMVLNDYSGDYERTEQPLLRDGITNKVRL